MYKSNIVLALSAILCCGVSAAQEVGDTLAEVVVTATGMERLLRDVPVQTEVISRKMLESYGGRSIEDILGGLTASFAFAEGDMGSQMQLGGLGNSYILILIDGKRIHGDVGGENDLGLIDPQNIERIEIVKGAQSALYGSDAMAGVINIITRKHEEHPCYAESTTRYGSHNDVRQHASVGFKAGRWTSSTNFQLQHNDGWQNTARQLAEGKVLTDTKTKTTNKFTNWQLGQRLTYSLGRSSELYAEGTYYTKRIYRPTDGLYPSCDVYTYDLMYRNASASAGGKWWVNAQKKDVVTVDVDWNLHNYYYKYTARTYEYVKLVGAQYGDMDGEWYSVPYYPGQTNLQSGQQRLMAQAKGVFHLPHAHTLQGGAEYRYDYLDAPHRTDSGTASDWKNLQEDDTTSDGDEDSGNDPSQENAQSIEQVEFTVAAGDTSAVVAQRLQEMGLVDDGSSFDHYLADQDMDNALLPGTYTIPKGSSYLEIAQVLTTKQTAPTEQ